MGDKTEKGAEQTEKTETAEGKDMPNSVQYSEEGVKNFMKITEGKEKGRK